MGGLTLRRFKPPKPRIPGLFPAWGAILGLFLALSPGLARGGVLEEGLDLDPAIPSPESFLGHPLGESFTPHHRLAAYLRELAARSPRLEIEEYGKTYEGRPLLLLTVSSPENLSRREEIRSRYQELFASKELTRNEAQRMAVELPIAVWLSFNIHGDEASSSEAAMALAYRLAADRSEEIQDLLSGSVVLIDPCLNPDGRDRYVEWLRGVTGSKPDPEFPSREHHQPWPGGRYNHYLFDLNRDWAWLTQAESRARTRAYLSWKPQVHVDFHEMWAEATYFFFPPESPIHPLLPPQVKRWADRFGEGNARTFDKRGWRYYTGESFDLYYPGYGDSWPSFHGATGMTYEQAGHGYAATAVRKSDGQVLTLAERTQHHYVAALSTISTAVANREERLLDFYRFFRDPAPGGPRAYFFPPGSDPPRTAELVTTLMAHGVEIKRAAASVPVSGLHAYDGSNSRTSLPPGTFAVSLDQPLSRFIRAVLEPEPALPDTFFYDVSAWSLPLAFGVEAYWSDKELAGGFETLAEPPVVQGDVVHPEAAYAFLISWKRNAAARAAARLLDRGVRLHFASRGFRIEGRDYSPGTLVMFVSENPGDLAGILDPVARETGVEVVGVDTGLTDSGPDLGSYRIEPLVKPRVAVVSGSPVLPTSLGACWFLLDQSYGIPYSLVPIEEISEDALRRYTVLVFPDDGAGGRGYSSEIDSSTVRVIQDWILEGGVFVGLGGGAFFATADRAGLSTVETAPGPDAELSEEEKEELEQKQRRETQAEIELREQREVLPGTIFRVQVDPLHPLGFGYDGEARVLKITNRALELGPPGTNVARFTASPKVSGYASARDVDYLAQRPFLVDEERGRGHVVLYVEDPNFRLFWYGLNKLFLNSLYFLSSPR